jgi:hypothetical protein
MRRGLKWCVVFFLGVIAMLAFRGDVLAESLSRTALEALWDQHMLKGEAGQVDIRDSRIDKTIWIPSAASFEPWTGRPWLVSTSHRLQVSRLDEGFWRNGGWILAGGLLAKVRLESSTLELHGKEIRRQFPYTPFPFHRTIPHETGYEFFLVHRPQGDSQATIIQRWVIPPSDVIVERDAHGGTSDWVGASLKYDNDTRTAMVSIAGLKREVVDRVQLSAELK